MFGLVKKRQNRELPAPERDAPQTLRNEILEDARRQAHKTLQRARQECEKLIAAARSEAETHAQETITAAQERAERQSAVKLAIVPVELGRHRATHIEGLLDVVRSAAAAQLAEEWRTGNQAEKVLALAAEAIRNMDGNSFTLHLADEAHKTLAANPQWITSLCAASGKADLRVELHCDVAPDTQGVIIKESTGRQIWDNRLATRLERAWPMLRIATAKELGLLE